MKIKAVIFDLDGTIASFNIDYKAVRADVRSFLIRVGVPASALSANESIFEMLKKTEIFMKNNGQSERVIEQTRLNALEIAEKYELEAAKYTSPFPEVKETLKNLKEKGLKAGLCTINSEKSTEYILEKFKIKEFFDAITPRESVRNVKPNVEHLKATLNALGVGPQESLVVGDGTSDMKCARALGAVAVGVLSGISTPKELKDSGANYLITSIADLTRLIEQINKVSAADEKGNASIGV